MCQLFIPIEIFLLTMLLVSLTPTNLINKMDRVCTGKLPPNTTCQCIQIWKGYIIKCPTSTLKSEISVQIKSNFNNAYIKSNDTDVNPYTYLPQMFIGNIKEVIFESDLLPSGPITQLFEHLGIKNVKIINFANAVNFTRHHFSGLNGLQGLNFFSTLFSIPDNLFEDLSELRELYLKSNKTALPSNIFAGLRKLETLDLRLNVTELPTGIFRNQRNMTSFTLQNYQSCNLHKETFEGAISLEELTFFPKGLAIFQSDTFSLLTNLRNISLNHKNISGIPAQLFHNNKNLVNVEIFSDSALLRTLPPALFANLPLLERVDISCKMENAYNDGFYQLHWSRRDFYTDNTTRSTVRISCGLSEIPGDLFANSSLIAGMILANNEFESIPQILFSGHFYLYHLDLSFNKLQSFPGKLLNDTKKLKVLKLSYNRLIEITDEYFVSLVNLKELHVNNNYLRTVNRYAFYKNKKLRYVNMANNHIHFGDPYYQKYSFLNNEPSSPFQFLYKLQILDLRNNSLDFIFKDWYQNMLNIGKLDLSYNSITLFDVRKFIFNFSHSILKSYSYNEISIDLSHNRIRWTNLTESLQNLPRKISVNLNYNPFDCNCKLLPFVQYLQGKQRKKFNFATDKLMCDKPDKLKGEHLRRIELKALMCPYDPEDCPRGCGCWDSTSESQLIVNCSNTNLTEILTLPRSKPLAFKSIELHIENNQLSELPRVSVPAYVDITHIYAAGNNLSQIDIDNLPPNLTHLDLSDNSFKRISANVLNFLNGSKLLNEIRLSGNPWICDCETTSFTQFVQRRHEIIADGHEIHCASPESHKKIIDLSYGDICQNENVTSIPIYLVVVCVFLSIGFLATTTVVFYSKFRTEIKVWMYKHRICLCLVNEEKLDKDKKYDAFISYAHKDTQFVAEHLVPELENCTNSFKLCVDVRDFIVGEYISDQIINAIDSSRRTIVVLSQNFVESVWAREEFRLAHQAALNEGRTRVIVIIYGDIGDTDLLVPDLKAYLKMNIYLKWGDPRFYAMPHQIQEQTSEVNNV